MAARVLPDEDWGVRLRHHCGAGVEVETVTCRGWEGLENGDLLRAATAGSATSNRAEGLL